MPNVSRTTLENFSSVIEPQLETVKKNISSQLQSGNRDIDILTSHITCDTGKMIRPALLLLSGLCLNDLSQSHIKTACVVEMIHLATLLHDDVIDQADRRRKKNTVNKLWGNENAVLLGDFVLARAFGLCAEMENPTIKKRLAMMTQTICLGEIRQNLNTGKNITEQNYIEIISDKTASFMACCCYLGGLISNGSEKQLSALENFGKNLGIAFQIRDDIMDIVGNESNAGKTLGTDIEKSNFTLPILHYLDNSNSDENLLLEKIDSGEDVAEILREAGSIDYANSQVEYFCNKAVENLTQIENCPAKTALIELAETMI